MAAAAFSMAGDVARLPSFQTSWCSCFAGFPLDRVTGELLLPDGSRRFVPGAIRIFLGLLLHRGQLSRVSLSANLWAGPHGPPLTSDVILHVYAHHLRRLLAGLPWRLSTIRGFGYALRPVAAPANDNTPPKAAS